MKLSPKLPPPELNGLDWLYGPLRRDPHTAHVVVALVDCARLTTDVDEDTVEVTARLTHVEAVRDPDVVLAQLRLLAQLTAQRTGQTALDLDTGEILDGGEAA